MFCAMDMKYKNRKCYQKYMINKYFPKLFKLAIKDSNNFFFDKRKIRNAGIQNLLALTCCNPVCVKELQYACNYNNKTIIL